MSSAPSPVPVTTSPDGSVTTSPGHHIRDYKVLSGEVLFSMSAQGGCLGASRERLAREIMIVDNVSHEDALEVVRGMARKNVEGLTMSLLPYNLGIGIACIAGYVSIPAVFSLEFAKAFNEVAVTTDVPQASDLNTMLEVGMWAWNWMGPPLGTVSFYMLCVQYARDQGENIGHKPYHTILEEKQGKKLAAAYPQYHKIIVRDYGQKTCFESDWENF